jgi:4'-phosphopantetheinyl transferase
VCSLLHSHCPFVDKDRVGGSRCTHLGSPYLVTYKRPAYSQLSSKCGATCTIRDVSVALSWPPSRAPQKIADEQIHVWGWPLDSPLEAAQVALLDKEELDRFHRFRFEPDRVRFAIAHATMRRILGAYLNKAPNRVLIRTTRFGKPELAGEEQGRPLHFNLSHSRSVALLALSKDTEVGVDVEDVKPIERGVAQSYFSAAELSALASLDGDAWLHGFYLCWTRKEAILKGEGIGLNLALDSFDVSLLPGAPAEILAARPCAGFRHNWKLHDLSVAPGSAAALAAGSPRAQLFCYRFE